MLTNWKVWNVFIARQCTVYLLMVALVWQTGVVTENCTTEFHRVTEISFHNCSRWLGYWHHVAWTMSLLYVRSRVLVLRTCVDFQVFRALTSWLQSLDLRLSGVVRHLEWKVSGSINNLQCQSSLYFLSTVSSSHDFSCGTVHSVGQCTLPWNRPRPLFVI